MSRRRIFKSPKRLGLADGVQGSIDRLERAVAEQIIISKRQFTADDVLKVLLPPEHIAVLRAAYPLLKDMDRTSFDGFLAGASSRLQVHINCPVLEIAAWRSDATLALDWGNIDNPLISLCNDLQKLNGQFNAVRDVADWLDVHATWGAVRYYWPSACALLPTDHPIHSIRGGSFREPADIGPMVPAFRETAMTVAGAMLCPLEIPSRNVVVISIEGRLFGVL